MEKETNNKSKGYILLLSEGLIGSNLNGSLDKLKDDFRHKLMELTCQYTASIKMRDFKLGGGADTSDIFTDYEKAVYKMVKKIVNNYY